MCWNIQYFFTSFMKYIVWISIMCSICKQKSWGYDKKNGDSVVVVFFFHFRFLYGVDVFPARSTCLSFILIFPSIPGIRWSAYVTCFWMTPWQGAQIQVWIQDTVDTTADCLHFHHICMIAWPASFQWHECHSAVVLLTVQMYLHRIERITRWKIS